MRCVTYLLVPLEGFVIKQTVIVMQFTMNIIRLRIVLCVCIEVST